MTKCEEKHDVDSSNAPDNMVLLYYKYARDEIKREDEITFQRTTLTLAFQGFLVTSSALMIGSGSSLHALELRRFLILLTISVAGFLLSLISFYGIKASRTSQYRAKDEWVEFNRRNGNIYPNYLPQITKNSDQTRRERKDRKGRLDFGSIHSQSIPAVMCVFWLCWIGVLGSTLF